MKQTLKALLQDQKFLYLLLLIFGWTLVVTTSFTMYFNQKIFIDNLIEEIWYRAIIDYGYEGWKSLSLSPSPALFPDFLFYFLGRKFSNHYYDAIFFSSFAQIILFTLSIFYLLRGLGVKQNTTISSIIFILIAVLNVVTSHSKNGIFFHNADDNFGATIVTIFATGLLIRYLDKRAKKYLITLVLISVLSVFNTPLFIVTFILPAALIFLINYLISEKTLDRKLHLSLFWIIIWSMIAGFILEPLFLPRARMAERITPDLMGQAILAFLKGTKEILSINYTPIVTLVYSFILSFMTVIWYIVRLTLSAYHTKYALNEPRNDFDFFAIKPFAVKHKDAPFNFFILFALVLVPINFIIPILVGTYGRFIDPDGTWGYRYFASAISISILAALAILDKDTYRDAFMRHSTIQRALLVCVVISCFYSILRFHSLKPNNRSVADIKYPYHYSVNIQLAHCLDKNQKKYSLDSGVTNKIHSLATNLFSKSNIHITSMEKILEKPDMVINKMHLAKHKLFSKNKPFYNFLIISKNDPDSTKEEEVFTKDFTIKPTTSFHCLIHLKAEGLTYNVNGGGFDVYVFDKNSGFNEFIYDKFPKAPSNKIFP